jgi:hypothetical protein
VNRANSPFDLRLPRALAALVAAVGLLALSACGGGGGDGPTGGTPTPPGQTVTISGKITFDRIPFKTALNAVGLDPNQPVESPARGVVVEALSASSTLASTTTDTSGNYSLSVPVSTQVKIRAKAQMTKTGTAPTWDFKVLNNTNSDALYALDGSFADSGTAASTRNLRAASGWNGTTYVDANRSAAPFAILDTVYKAQQLVLSAVPATAFPALSLFWSSKNTSSDSFCPDTGNILTSVYFGFDAGDTDDCATPQAGVDGIYILGDFASGNGDTDEFDQHVIAHEFGHYLEDKFSRTDSIGGNHSIGDLLDLRVAFGEGWGDAFSGMALNDPVYKDSQSGVNAQTGFNLDADNSGQKGSYSEASVFQFLWDVFDAGTESGDTVALGFTPIWNTFIGAEKTTTALTSIYSFSSALIADNSSAASGIRALLNREQIFGTDAFASGETNFAGKTTPPNTLDPLYTTITLGSSVQVCGTRDFGTNNKLGNRRFLRLDLATSRALQITAIGPATVVPVAADPDIGLWGRGYIARSEAEGVTETFNTAVLSAGTYIIEVGEFSHIDPSNVPNSSRRGDTCMTVNVSGS